MDGSGVLLGEVSEAQRFDVQNLERFLSRKLEGFGSRLQVRQIQGGASNPTFFLQAETPDGEQRFVLRKKPPGPLLASAHQVDREHRVMQALAQTDVPVPRMRLYCGDPEIIGTQFYVMEYLEGRIFRDATLPGLAPEERRKVYDELNATLAKLHAVDYEAVGLGDFGRPGSYFERQIARWIKQYRGAETAHVTAMERLMEELPRRIPSDQSVSIAHGDYRLENVMFHPTEPRLIAVLDWELSTIGHPLADLGYNGYLWHSAGASWGSLQGVDFSTSGIPTEAEYVEAYLRRTGREEIEDWNFYLAFAAFRLASISQGVYQRILNGVVPSEREAVNGAPHLAEVALDLLEQTGLTVGEITRPRSTSEESF